MRKRNPIFPGGLVPISVFHPGKYGHVSFTQKIWGKPEIWTKKNEQARSLLATIKNCRYGDLVVLFGQSHFYVLCQPQPFVDRIQAAYTFNLHNLAETSGGDFQCPGEILNLEAQHTDYFL